MNNGIDKKLTLNQVLEITKNATNLEQLKYDLGVARSELLAPKKYRDSTFNGKKITSVRFYENGAVFLITEDGEHEFKIDDKEDYKFFRFGENWSADFALCAISNEDGVLLSK